MTDQTYTLNNGVKIPKLGLGTWQSAPGEVARAVSVAIQAGYRLIDAAYCYGNEDEVGQGIRDGLAATAGKVKREDLFVVSKVWATYSTRVEENLAKSLEALGLEYVDLYLVHWPVAMNPEGNHDKFPKLPNGERDIVWTHDHVETWKQLEALVPTGKVKAIGVSNYSVRYLNELLSEATIVPAVNQIENHPALPQQDVVDLCRSKGIHIMAYSPLGSTGGPLFKAEPVVKLAEKHGVEPAIILLSYHLPRGSTVLAKSVTPERIHANAKLVDLSAEDSKLLDEYSERLGREGKLERFVYPAFGVDFGFPDQQTGRVVKRG